MKVLRLSEIILIGIVFFFVLGVALGTCCAGGPPPAVSVDVDASAQVAIEEEAPVLPDDFARNDPPMVSAEWGEVIPPPVTGSDDNPERPSVVTLFTSDGTWRCGPCEDQSRHLAAIKPKFSFQTIPVPAAGQSPSGKVPFWWAPDGAVFEGSMDPATLSKWIADHAAKTEAVSGSAAKEVSDRNSMAVVKVEGSSSSAVLAAFTQHLAFQRNADLAVLPGVRTWLPEIDVDINDPFLKVLDGLLSREGMQLGGGKISWPAGRRLVSFDPPIDVSYRKILEVSATVKAVEVNGREVVVRMGGRLIPDLKVILK